MSLTIKSIYELFILTIKLIHDIAK